MNKLPPKHIATLIPACCHPGSNRVDVGMNGAIWQAMDYYPFGLTMASSYLPGQQRWLFGGKELDRTSGLELFDFEARTYDPATGRFRQPDPLAEKYYPLSSYLYCAANPLVNTDPTGKDYNLIVEDESITINAYMFTFSNYMESANYGADIINDHNGMWDFEFVDSESGSTFILPVCFDVQVSELEMLEGLNEKSSFSVQVQEDSNPGSNLYLVAPDNKMNENANGEYGNRLITVRESRAKTETVAHEYGHGLGAIHQTEGLMSKMADFHRTKFLDKKSIEDMIKYPLKGKVNQYRDWDFNKLYTVGKGNLNNKSKYSIKDLKKGKLIPHKNTNKK